jgi:hypothetical protein
MVHPGQEEPPWDAWFTEFYYHFGALSVLYGNFPDTKGADGLILGTRKGLRCVNRGS